MAEFTQLKAKAPTMAQSSSSGILPRKYHRGGFESGNNADQDSVSRDTILPATVGHDFGKVQILSDQRTEPSDSQQPPAALTRQQLNYTTVNALSFTYASPGGSSDFGQPLTHADAGTGGAGEEEVNGAPSEVEPESEPVSAEGASGAEPAAPEQTRTVVEQHQQRFTAFIKRAARPQESALGEEATNAQAGEVPRPGQTLRLPDLVILPQSASQYADAIAAAFSYKSSITKGGATPPAGDFGITRPFFQMKMSGSQDAAGFHLTCDVDGQITFQLTSMGRTDIASDSDADINQGNYPKVVSDLTPNMNDLNGRPPRDKFWAEDLTEKHERKHAGEDVTFGQAGTTLADKWLNKQTASTEAQVKAKVAQALEIVKQKVDNEMKPPDSEKRAYGDGAPSYKARADAIKAKGDANKYPAAPPAKGTAPAAPVAPPAAPKAPVAPANPAPKNPAK